jgi:hypothetical protein
MRIGDLDLAKGWDDLIEQGKFIRKHKDEQMEIAYGVRKEGDGRYRFFVSGAENGKKVTEEDFIGESSRCDSTA